MKQFLTFALLSMSLLLSSTNVIGGLLSEALVAGRQGQQFLDLSSVPAYQNATRAGESAGNYSLDAIGSLTLVRREQGWLNHTDLVFWTNVADTFGGGNSIPELAGKAGLLWDTNDISADSASTTLLVLGLEQWFLEKQLSISFGKYFPGQYFLLSPYTADNSNSFSNKMISSNPVASFWESIGIGVNASYYSDKWALSGGFVDAQATEVGFDFSSFSKSNYAYMMELTYEPGNTSGISAWSLLAYRVDERNDIESEHGLVVQFTHELAMNSEYATFGRYTVRNGGLGKTTAAQQGALPVNLGGFIGVAWNRPFGRDKQQLAASLIYGEATEFKQSQGFNNQYGIEAFWKFETDDWFHVTPSIQLLRNNIDQVETIIGIRAKFGVTQRW